MKAIAHGILSLSILSCAWALNAQTSGAATPFVNSPPPSDPKAVAVMASAQAAFGESTSVADVTITGTAVWIAGSERETVAATLKQRGAFQSAMSLQGLRSEVRNDGSIGKGSWTDKNGVGHSVQPHNCFTPAGWFSPVAVFQAAQTPEAVLSYVGSENRDGISVDHVRYYRFVPSAVGKPSKEAAAFAQKLTTVDVVLEQASHLLISIAFLIHPDNDAGFDIPVEVRFSDYRPVNGLQVPFRIQKLIQGALALDFTATSATVNSGLTDSEFALATGGGQ